MMIDLVKTLAGKMKGFSRRETVEYYKDIVQRAWAQVEAAETPEVKSEKFAETMEWTMLDKDYDDRTRRTFQQAARSSCRAGGGAMTRPSRSSAPASSGPSRRHRSLVQRWRIIPAHPAWGRPLLHRWYAAWRISRATWWATSAISPAA